MIGNSNDLDSLAELKVISLCDSISPSPSNNQTRHRARNRSMSSTLRKYESNINCNEKAEEPDIIDVSKSDVVETTVNRDTTATAIQSPATQENKIKECQNLSIKPELNNDSIEQNEMPKDRKEKDNLIIACLKQLHIPTAIITMLFCFILQVILIVVELNK